MLRHIAPCISTGGVLIGRLKRRRVVGTPNASRTERSSVVGLGDADPAERPDVGVATKTVFSLLLRDEDVCGSHARGADGSAYFTRPSNSRTTP